MTPNVLLPLELTVLRGDSGYKQARVRGFTETSGAGPPRWVLVLRRWHEDPVCANERPGLVRTIAQVC